MVLDFVYISIIIALGMGFINRFRKELTSANFKRLQYLFFFHLLIGTYYCFFISGDAVGYWEIPKKYSFKTFLDGIVEGEGTQFLMSLNYIFTNFLEMPYLSNTLLFSLFGFIGMTFFYMVVVKTIPYVKVLKGHALFPLLFFLPNLHIWSVSIGKDSILFMCIGMFAYSILKPLSRIPLIAVSVLLALAIRPHMVLFMLVGFGIAYVFGGKVSGIKRIIFSAILIGVGIAILPRVLEFAKIEDASVEAFDNFAQYKSGVLSRASSGSAIDISSYPFPLKVVTFWFRPLFFDAHNINSLLASIENILLVSLFVMAMRLKPLKAFKAAPFVIKGLVIFLIVGTLAFSQSLGNLGIMIRMRNMFLPGMLIFLLWVFSYHYQTRLKK